MPAQLPVLSHRPERPEDEPLLFELYSSTRQEELDAVNFPAEMRGPFLTMQFTAQRRGYASTFPNANFQIILVNGQDAGRMVIDRANSEIQLVDMVLLPGHRNVGIGTALVQALIHEAAAAKKPIRLHVLQGNRAIRLYERLGFRKTAEMGIYDEMEWREPHQPDQP